MVLPRNRIPTHPGEILLEEFLEPAGMSQQKLADKMGVPIQRVNGLVNGKRDMTPETALLLAKVFDVSPEFWMNLQTARDLALAKHEMERAS